jgi:hypothetical protein
MGTAGETNSWWFYSTNNPCNPNASNPVHLYCLQQ